MEAVDFYQLKREINDSWLFTQLEREVVAGNTKSVKKLAEDGVAALVVLQSGGASEDAMIQLERRRANQLYARDPERAMQEYALALDVLRPSL